MPTPDYSKSCIYMLRHKDDFELQHIYIGSTTNFKVRKYDHKKTCCNPNNKNHHYKIYQYIRDNGGWDEWLMIWIEDYPCKSKRELELREDQVMLEYQNRLNERRSSRSKKEWNEDNKDHIKNYHDQYRKNNKDKINEISRKFLKNNKVKIYEKRKQKITCDICGSEVRKTDIKRHKETKKCQSHFKNSTCLIKF